MADGASSAPAPAPAPVAARGRPTAAPGPIELSDEKTVQTLATPDSFGAPLARLSPSPTGHGYGSTPPSAASTVRRGAKPCIFFAPAGRRETRPRAALDCTPRLGTPKTPAQRHIHKTRRQFPAVPRPVPRAPGLIKAPDAAPAPPPKPHETRRPPPGARRDPTARRRATRRRAAAAAAPSTGGPDSSPTPNHVLTTTYAPRRPKIRWERAHRARHKYMASTPDAPCAPLFPPYRLT